MPGTAESVSSTAASPGAPDSSVAQTLTRDGSVSNGRLFAELKGRPGEQGVPDGMKVDQEGNVYCTGPNGIWTYDQNGRFLGRIVTPEVPANLAWGDADWRTLYITARTSLYRLRTSVPGIPVGVAAMRVPD